MNTVSPAKESLPSEDSSAQPLVSLESILCTEELQRRPSRPPDYEKENRALVPLMSILADSPNTVFQTLADTILEITQSHSAGVSLLTRDGKELDVCGNRFFWPAISGAWKQYIGGGTPRNFGPCGDVLDRNCSLLFRHLERRYTYFPPPINECLLVPFYVEGKAVGTIWALAHDDLRKFDSEDSRLMASLGKFAASAYQALKNIDDLKFQVSEREKAEAEVRELAKGLEAKIRRLVEANVVGIIMFHLDGAITYANAAFLHMVQFDRDDLASGRVGWADLTPAEWRASDERAIAEIKTTGTVQPYEKEYLRKDGSRVPVMVGGALFKGSQSDGVAFVVDLSEQKRAEDQLRAVMSERTRLSVVRAEIAMALASKDSLRGILHRCAETMVRHLDAAFARIWTLKSGAAELELEASAGMYTRLDGRFARIAVGQHKIGLIAQERKPHLTNDVQNDPRINDHNWTRAEKMQSFAGYPLIVEDRVVGVMGMFSRQALSESTMETLASIADGIAQGIDRKRAEDALKLLKDQLHRENIALRDEVDRASMFEEIVGTSDLLKAVLSRVAKVAPSDSTVLITGETGTGKELIARAIHKKSQRSRRAFVSVNCAAIPRDLIPSELFGHEKGAFTGALQRRLGRFELADGGTIFLDEVGELLPDTQVALLRVLQEREFERIGGGQTIHVDVRVIAATNRDLEAAVANGSFRQDLLYRLNVVPIEVPPLRERKEDILLLVEYFVQRYAAQAGKDVRSIDKRTLDLLQSYDWPGNIRELQNVIERSVILSSGNVFSVDELWLSREVVLHATGVKESPTTKDQVAPISERKIIEAALAETRGRVSGPAGAATKLGIPPSTLETRIKALNINKAQFKFR